MKTYLLIGWLLIPVAAAAYHFGPGQKQAQLDGAAAMLRKADGFAAKEQWKEAVAWYDKAITALPAAQESQRRRARLEKAKAMMLSGQLPDSFLELQALSGDLAADRSAGKEVDPALVERTQEALANAQYYVTWSLRLEGEPLEQWEPIIESSRQSYRLLADEARQSSDAEAAKRQSENVEAAIRLARMDLDELQALPIPMPVKCSGSCNCCCNGNCKGKGKGKGKKVGKPKDSRSAGVGAEVDTTGS